MMMSYVIGLVLLVLSLRPWMQRLATKVLELMIG